ncbi:MAG: DegV family protein [Anaerolineae bacterium]|jgi:DegV family protein with EDD domain
MANVRIITDVTAHLEPEVIERHKITVLPVEVRFGDEAFDLGQDKDRELLFQRMAEGPAQSSVATIPASVFQETYARLNRETEEILVLVASSQLCGAYEQARLAARNFLGRCRITVLDSMSASWGLGLMVKGAARAAARGDGLDEVVRRVRGLMPHIYLVFFVERLDYLERGGRVGPAQALLGTMLQIKPLLLMEDGDIVPLEKVRTRQAAVEKLSDFVAEFASIEQVLILKSPIENEVNELVTKLREQLRLSLPDQKFPSLAYDPILACHLGPEALGVVVFEGL